VSVAERRGKKKIKALPPIQETRDAWWAGKPSIRVTRWMPHEPTAKQHAFLWLQTMGLPDEALYGGAAGGGKSDALLLAALQYVDVPGYSAILFRRSLTDLALEGALIPRSKEWLSDTDAVWHEQRKSWTFPSGATLQFAYLKDADSKYRYQGAEFQFIGFDELTQFPESDYTYLFSRLRRPRVEAWMNEDLKKQKELLAKVPLRMRVASNPGGRGHRWVKARFIARGTRGDRLFIPARLKDNPYVDQEAYEAALNELDPQTRDQLLEGNWDARGPGHWMIDHLHLDACLELGHEFDKLLDLGKMPPPKAFGYDEAVINGGIDWGEHTQAYAIWELPHGGIYIAPSETVSTHSEPGATTDEIVPRWTKFGYPLGEARYDAAGIQSMRTFKAITWERCDRGTLTTSLTKLKIVKIPFNSYKVETIKYMRYLAARSYKARNADIIPHQVLAISPRNVVLAEQIFGWERKSEETEEAIKENDHGPDALVAGIAPISRRHRDRVDAELNKAKEAAAKAKVAA
jgi:hypothetical protein